MRNLLFAAIFTAGAVAPAMAQEFTPQPTQLPPQQRVQPVLTPGPEASGGSGQASGGWLPYEPPSTGTFNTETSDPNFIERSHGHSQS